MKADLFRYMRDASGEWLCIRTKDPQSFLATVKDGKEYTVEIKEYKPKRGLSANGMYWLYLNKLAGVLRTSSSELHNIMLRRYGQVERYGEQLVYIVLPDTEEAEKKALQAETYHIKPTSQVKEGKDGIMYRTYILLRGSSTYEKSEFSALLDGLLSECREVGIPIISESERALLGDEI